jgi:predicted phage-related endonuclease
MSYTIIDVPQRSPEWFTARLGRLTGSVAKDMLATIKSGEAAARRDLRTKLALERITGQPQEDGYVNTDMQRGIDLEPKARLALEAVHGLMVEQTGFVAHDDLMAGCSLDGHVVSVSDTLVSLKCPKSATHLGYLRERDIPAAYVPQMLHECWVTGARSYVFASYDDRFPEKLRLVTVFRAVSDKEVDDYAGKALAFLAEVDAEVRAIEAMLEG